MSRLNPFFSYFGSKFRLASKYPEPVHNHIIEPFAGSAGYALCYPDRNVHLVDAFDQIVDIWKYLIDVPEHEFLSLPLGPFSKEFQVKDLDLDPGAKALIGFWTTESQTTASNYPLSKSRGSNWTERKRAKLANQLQYIRHWTVSLSSYADLSNRDATWFIDPPYEKAGKRYRHSTIDYTELGEWCKSRNGQTIVCEQEPATWLPFVKLSQVSNASNKQYAELVWHKH